MTSSVTVLATKKLKGATFKDGLWSVTRSIAGQVITFEATTPKDLTELVDLAVTQHLKAIAAESLDPNAATEASEAGGKAVQTAARDALQHPWRDRVLLRRLRTLFSQNARG